LIVGFVNVRREAIIRMTVRGPHTDREIEAIVDTGFDGNLTLPPSLIEALDLPFRERGRAVLADGSDVSFDIHEAEIVWDECPRTIAVGVADAEPLLGTSLLDGYELTVRFVDEGEVKIKAANGPRS
jgi:clan AA aspartic protease